MKPPIFEYVRVDSVDQAVAELVQHGEDAKVLAGGQSLIPILNMRLASPRVLVDLNPVKALAYIEDRDGGVAIGAMTRQRMVENSSLIASRLPLLAEAIRWVGHFQIRNRGTIGGSLAHADPAAELPAVAVCLGARLTLRGPSGERVLGASEFYRAYLTTALEPTELVTEVWFPATRPRTGSAWAEFARRHGDYALVGVGAVVTLADDRIREARLALTGVGGNPVQVRGEVMRLVGQQPTATRLEEAAEAVRGAIDPEGDIHATAEYRRQLARVLSGRALRLAVERAGDGESQ